MEIAHWDQLIIRGAHWDQSLIIGKVKIEKRGWSIIWLYNTHRNCRPKF